MKHAATPGTAPTYLLKRKVGSLRRFWSSADLTEVGGLVSGVTHSHAWHQVALFTGLTDCSHDMQLAPHPQGNNVAKASLIPTNVLVTQVTPFQWEGTTYQEVQLLEAKLGAGCHDFG
ncbi:hypothetical protein Cadr_000013399 [Camelus dromedarius]|uniref:Uncharacterized protein n=1 Tax=Camelus dromedarius TaxID=9838 RepID=A0A5N4DBI1_CAMDR|nr:hypothetical protein Cadr_000013399 [Camelus dromedarius]